MKQLFRLLNRYFTRETLPHVEPNVVLEKTGQLEWGYFYELIISDDEEFMSLEPIPTNRYLSNQPKRIRTGRRFEPVPIRATIAWGDSSPHTLIYGCSRNPEHVTQEYWNDVKIELIDGTHLPDLLEMDADAQHSIIFSEQMANLLRTTSLTGYELCELTVSRPLAQPYRLFELRFMGRKCFRPLSVINAPNECPWCHQTEVICPECGESPYSCPNCDNDIEVAAKNRKGPDDPRLISAGWSNWLPAIIEVDRWDGSDFIFGSLDKGIRNQVVTGRVIDWLFEVDAKPFYARPVLANVENISEEKKQTLSQVKKKQ